MKDWYPDFITKMRNRVHTSYYKYGSLSKAKRDLLYPRDELRNCEYRISIYKKTGNPEFLVDAANFLMFEFAEMRGAFRATDDDKDSKII